MNREIRFRGKRLDNGEWIYSNESFVHTEVGVFIGPYNEEKQVDPETVGQYTGVKDDNGKEIYEGDILTMSCSEEDDEWTTEVEQYGIVEYPVGDTDYTLLLWVDEFADREVIGNIHDNPELLKGGEI